MCPGLYSIRGSPSRSWFRLKPLKMSRLTNGFSLLAGRCELPGAPLGWAYSPGILKPQANQTACRQVLAIPSLDTNVYDSTKLQRHPRSCHSCLSSSPRHWNGSLNTQIGSMERGRYDIRVDTSSSLPDYPNSLVGGGQRQSLSLSAMPRRFQRIGPSGLRLSCRPSSPSSLINGGNRLRSRFVLHSGGCTPIQHESSNQISNPSPGQTDGCATGLSRRVVSQQLITSGCTTRCQRRLRSLCRLRQHRTCHGGRSIQTSPGAACQPIGSAHICGGTRRRDRMCRERQGTGRRGGVGTSMHNGMGS